MKKIVALLCCLCLLVGTAMSEITGGLIFFGDDNGTDDTLEVTVKKAELMASWNDETADQQAYVVVYADIVNWGVDEIDLSKDITATLVWQNTYTFDAEIQYERNDLGMLVSTTGTFAFCVPYIVAFAPTEEIKLNVVKADITEEKELFIENTGALDTNLRPSFDYATRNSDTLDVKLTQERTLTEYNGETDDAYRWIKQEFELINWSKEAANITSSELGMVLSYMNKYGIVGEIEVGNYLEPLHTMAGTAVFKVPLRVAEAEESDLGLIVALSEKQWQLPLTISYVDSKFADIVPDPALITGKAGTFNRSGYIVNEKSYTVYQYAKPTQTEATGDFLEQYIALAQERGFITEQVMIGGRPVLTMEDGTGKTALLYYEYAGWMLLMIEDGQEADTTITG